MTDLPIVHTVDVKPEWVDYNRHMGDFAYGIVFSEAGDGFLELAGLDPAYREATGCTIYTLENHTRFIKEVHLGDRLTTTAHLLDCDPKRVHLYLHLYDGAGDLVAEQEQLIMHMRQAKGEPPRPEPFPEDMLAKLEAILVAHRQLPRPEGAGRPMGIRRKSAPAA